MIKRVHFLIVAILLMLCSCSGSATGGKDADNKTTKQVTAVVDSLVALEPEMKLTSLEVIQAPLPSIMADDVKPALNKSMDAIMSYIFGNALGGKKTAGKEQVEMLVAMGAPLREAMSKYESEQHPEYVFGLAKVANVNDSTHKEKRLCIFEAENLNKVKEYAKLPQKASNDFAMVLMLAYGDQIDLDKEDTKPEDLKAIADNPILRFILEDN